MSEGPGESPRDVKCPYCGTVRPASDSVCPRCGLGHAAPLPGARHKLPPPPEPETRPFWQEFRYAFVYPVSLGSITVLAATSFGFALFSTSLASDVQDRLKVDAGILALLLAVLFVYHLFDMIQTSAGGARRPPGLFAGFFNAEYEPYETLFFGIEGLLVSLLPVLIYLLLHDRPNQNPNPVTLGALLALSCLYLPTTLLSLAVWRDLLAVSPHIVIPAAFKLPVPNALAAVILYAGGSLHASAIRLTSDREVSFGLLFLTWLAGFYLYFVAGRVIGISHWIYRKQLGWFRDM